ncbi:YI31B protein, partial [Pseudoatta argentina]
MSAMLKSSAEYNRRAAIIEGLRAGRSAREIVYNVAKYTALEQFNEGSSTLRVRKRYSKERTATIPAVVERTQALISDDPEQSLRVLMDVVGHHILAKDFATSLQKVEAIRNFLKSQNVKELRRFLGMVNFYHRFIPDIAKVQSPLQEAIIRPKQSEQTQIEWTTEFFSRKLIPAQCNYSAYDRQLLRTTHHFYASIKHFSPRQCRQLTYISEFTTDIRHVELQSSSSSLERKYHPQSNGLIEQPEWTDVLPAVLLGLRSCYEEDIHALIVELFYGRTPDKFFDHEDMPNKHNFSFRRFMQRIRPIPTAHHVRNKPFRYKDLHTCTHTGGSPYSGPHRIIEKISDRVFTIKVEGRRINISTEHLKSAYFVTPQEEHAKPYGSPIVPNTISSSNDPSNLISTRLVLKIYPSTVQLKSKKSVSFQ